MKRKAKIEIDSSVPGAVIYREGGKEYRFPVFEDDGEIVFVGEPSGQRLFLLFWSGGWTYVPTRLEAVDRERITAHIRAHYQEQGARIRVMSRSDAEPYCQFHPELFEARTKASEVLAEAGFRYLRDYLAIDLLHEEYGLEVGGIVERSSVEPIMLALSEAFPHWHFGDDEYEHFGPEPGWRAAIYMFSRCCPSGSCGG